MTKWQSKASRSVERVDDRLTVNSKQVYHNMLTTLIDSKNPKKIYINDKLYQLVDHRYQMETKFFLVRKYRIE